MHVLQGLHVLQELQELHGLQGLHVLQGLHGLQELQELHVLQGLHGLHGLPEHQKVTRPTGAFPGRDFPASGFYRRMIMTKNDLAKLEQAAYDRMQNAQTVLDAARAVVDDKAKLINEIMIREEAANEWKLAWKRLWMVTWRNGVVIDEVRP